MAGTALAVPAFSFGHATSAPLGITSLSEYVLQPPDEGDIGGSQDDQGDSTDVIHQQGGFPGPGTMQPPGSVFAPDTSVRRDSLPGFPHNFPAPAETIVPRPPYYPSPPTPGAGKPSAPAKHPLFGLSPIALIVGLVVLHVVVVSMVAK